MPLESKKKQNGERQNFLYVLFVESPQPNAYLEDWLNEMLYWIWNKPLNHFLGVFTSGYAAPFNNRYHGWDLHSQPKGLNDASAGKDNLEKGNKVHTYLNKSNG